ncbi:MAG: creatininase family protein [Actinomycetota bacterium]
MRLQLATWPEVEAYLARSANVILPVGSTEQHGPNGLIGTDAICAEAVAWRVGERLDTMVGPTIGIGMAQHHMAFPGSMTFKPSTLLAVMRDCLLSLARHGFERVLVINGHGGNTPTLLASFAEAQMELDAMAGMIQENGGHRPPLRCRVINWWETPEVDRLSTELFGDAVGSHATPPEVALTLALHPDRLDQRPLDPPVAPRANFHGASDFRARFPDGRIGSNPTLATPESGRRILDAAVTELSAMAESFFNAG